MFLGEAINLVIYQIFKYFNSQQVKDLFVKDDPTGGMGYKRLFLLTTTLSICDLIATYLKGVGLLYCSASITQILRSFLIVIVFAFSGVFLKRQPRTYQLFGVIAAIFGLTFIGISAVL